MKPSERWVTVATSLLLLLFLSAPVRAQIFPFEYYTSSNGLLSNATTCVFQDSRGYLHIGSAEGLSTFDGYSFTHIRTKDNLPSNFINSITETPSLPGTLWLGTNNGLAKVEPHKITHILMDTTELSRHVWTVEEDAMQQLWCATRGGLYTLRQDTIEKVHLPVKDLFGLDVLKPGSDSLMWVTAANALLAFTVKREILHQIQISPSPKNHATAVLRDRTNAIWIGLRDGTLSRYRGRTLVHTRHVTSGRIMHLMEDETGRLYIGTDDGIMSIDMAEFSTGLFQHIGQENGLPGGSILGGVVDAEGDLWFVCNGSGISRLKTQGLLEFPIEGIPEAYNNMRAACDSAGRYWVLSGSDLVEIRSSTKGVWTAVRHKVYDRIGGKPHGVVYDSKNNRIWFTYAGETIQCYGIANRANGKTELRRVDVTGPRRLAIRPLLITIDNNGRLWYIDSLYLAVRGREGSWDYSLTSLFGDSDVRTMLSDSKGNIWLGGFSKGIAVMYGDSLNAPPRLLTPHVNIPAGFIRAFCEDGLGRMWVGTRYSGCMIISGDTVRTLSSADVLPSDAVWTITRDSTGVMWVGTSEGLVAIDPVTLLPDPVGSDLVRGAVVSSGTSRNGLIWYITPKGLGLIDRAKLRAPSSTIKVRLVRTEVEGQPVDLSQPLEFQHFQNSFTFTFLPSSLRNTQDIRFQCRLIGANDDWLESTRQRTVAYASLRPGKYQFEVRATRIGMAGFGMPGSLEFTIIPPLWETWWFRASGLIVIVGMLYVMRMRKIRQLQRETRAQQEFSRRLLESQENERKRIAGELHDSLVQDLLVAKNRSLMGLKNVQDAGRVERELEAISSALGNAIDEVREIAHNLRPYQLDRMGFSKAVRSLMTRFSESTHIRLDATIDDVDRELNETTATHLYRVIQEALNNILKHSGAGSASISLRVRDRSVELHIRDDGKGMPAEGRAGFGLDGIAQRVSLIGGTHEISSINGKGTSLLIRITKQTRADGKEDHGSHSG